MYKTITIFYIIIIFTGCYKDNDNNAFKTSVVKNDLEKRFSKEFLLEIKSDEDNPIYSLKSIAISDSLLFLADDKRHKIFKFNKSGELLDSWGRQGRGPLEFLNISSIGFFDEGTLFVVDGGGNARVHLLSFDGEIKKIFPVASVGPFREAFFETKDDSIFFLVNTIVPCENDIRVSCVHLIQDMNGNKIKAIGEADKIWPNHSTLPFISAFHNGRFYTANTFGSQILKYDLNNQIEDILIVENFDFINFVDESSLPTNVYEQVIELNRRSFTSIQQLEIHDNHLILEFLRRGSKYSEIENKRFLVLYNLSNDNVYIGFESNDKMIVSTENGIVFIREIENRNYGHYELYKLIEK